MNELSESAQLVVEFHDSAPEGLSTVRALHGDDVTVVESKSFSAEAYTT